MKRLGSGVLLLLLVSVLVFLATQALPGDPTLAILGTNRDPAVVDALRQELQLDEPLLAQYWHWISGVLTGDLGNSLVTDARVWDTINDRIVNSLILLGLAAIVAIPLSIILGIVSAARRDRLLDKIGNVASMTLAAIPAFVIALTLVMVFSTTLFHLLPSVTIVPEGSPLLAQPEQLVLPVATLVLTVVPYLFRMSRASMIEALESEYVAMARLKGMPERIVLLRHALPNALIPTVQASAIVLSYLLGGVVVVEYVFNYPGLGTSLTSAVANRDLPVIQGVILLFASGVVIFNLLADIATFYLTPRLRTGRS